MDRGRALFIAAGCNQCHVKADDAALLDVDDVIAVGPALTGRSWPTEFIVKKVTDPSSVAVPAGQRTRMPRLEVSPEHAALIATYLNARQVAERR
jgi:mono/diheme cytochrome c family protein